MVEPVDIVDEERVVEEEEEPSLTDRLRRFARRGVERGRRAIDRIRNRRNRSNR